MLMFPSAALGGLHYKTNNGTITITGIDWDSVVNIPKTINGLTVTGIGDYAFRSHTNVWGVTILNTVTNIGVGAFYRCAYLHSLIIPTGVVSIAEWTFAECGLPNIVIPTNVTSIGNAAFIDSGLNTITIPDSVRDIGVLAFAYSYLGNITIPGSLVSIADSTSIYCRYLTNVTIGENVTNIGNQAFAYCGSLSSIRFNGNAPTLDSEVFLYNNYMAMVYYLPGTSGWGPMYGDRPTTLWQPQVQTTDPSFGVRTNQFGFNITWANGQVVVVEACTNLANPIWSPLQTNTLSSDSLYFSDPQWTNYLGRFYRVRSD